MKRGKGPGTIYSLR